MTNFEKIIELRQSLEEERNQKYELRRLVQDLEDENRKLRSKLELLLREDRK